MLDRSETAMASKGKRNPGGRPSAGVPVKALTVLKGSDAYEDWLDRLVEFTRCGTRAQLLKNAVLDHYEKVGFREPPPKR